MKTAVVQTRPEFGDKAANIARAVDLMKSEDADLYVLTELFSTGYLFTSREELFHYPLIAAALLLVLEVLLRVLVFRRATV